VPTLEGGRDNGRKAEINYIFNALETRGGTAAACPFKKQIIYEIGHCMKGDIAWSSIMIIH
jgi:hypothetical protein